MIEEIQLSRENSSGVEKRLDYDVNGSVIYIGFAQLNTPTSSPGWLIMAYTVNGSLQVTRIRYSKPNQIWDNRATLLP